MQARANEDDEFFSDAEPVAQRPAKKGSNIFFYFVFFFFCQLLKL
jgi:hypothetical protein